MEPNHELNLDESVRQVMQTLPPVIRKYLSQEKYTIVAKNLMLKYGLRVDQGGVLEREIMLLLMGIENPDDFAASLKNEATLSEDVVRAIMIDVNQEIFLPLQEEMRRGETSTPESAKLAAPPMPPRHIINKIPMPPVTPKLMVSDNKLLEDHEEPHIEFTKMPPPPPRPVTFPPNLPGALRPPEAFGGGGGMPSAPPQPQRPVAPVKPYSSDPYREPINEKE